MGIDEALLPTDFIAAEALADCIARRLFQSSQAGRELMAALVERINAHVLFPGVTNYLVRRLAGDRVADILGVTDDAAFRGALGRLAPLPFVERMPLGKLLPQISSVVGQALLSSLISHKLGGALPGFAAPTSSTLRHQPDPEP